MDRGQTFDGNKTVSRLTIHASEDHRPQPKLCTDPLQPTMFRKQSSAIPAAPSMRRVIALLWLVSTSASTWNSATWQASDSRSNILEQSTYDDLPPTVFSPTGRLHSVERAVEATKADQPRANVVVAVQCQDGMLILSTLAVSPFLNTSLGNSTEHSTSLFLEDKPSTTSPVFQLEENVLAATAGNAVDGQVLRSKIHAYAEYLMQASEDLVSPSELTRRLADHLQVPTQNVGGQSGRMLAVRYYLLDSTIAFIPLSHVPL